MRVFSIALALLCTVLICSCGSTPQHAVTPTDSEPLVQGEPNALYSEAITILQGHRFEKYQQAFPLLLSAAKQGHPQAQYELALLYSKGRGVPFADPEQAFFWHERAALQGDYRAMTALAGYYYKGYGTQVDYKEALFWLSNASELGDPQAQYNIGVLHLEGKGVERSPESAAAWFELAARNWHKDAQYTLGMLYATGKGVEQDYIRSYAWFAVAAHNNHSDAPAQRDFVARELDQAPLAEARSLTNDIIAKHER